MIVGKNKPFFQFYITFCLNSFSYNLCYTQVYNTTFRMDTVWPYINKTTVQIYYKWSLCFLYAPKCFYVTSWCYLLPTRSIRLRHSSVSRISRIASSDPNYKNHILQLISSPQNRIIWLLHICVSHNTAFDINNENKMHFRSKILYINDNLDSNSDTTFNEHYKRINLFDKINFFNFRNSLEVFLSLTFNYM